MALLEMSSQSSLWKNKVYVSFLPTYIREVWDYENAKVKDIQQSFSGINWDFTFQEKNINQKVKL